MINTVIITIDENTEQNYTDLIHTNCPDLDVLAIKHNAHEGIQAIIEHKPSIVFLDVEAASKTELTLLNDIEGGNFKIIFVTSINHSAYKALELQAYDYIVKPMSPDDLMRLNSRIVKDLEKAIAAPVLEEAQLSTELDKLKASDKIAIPIRNGIQFIYKKDIVYLEASSNYTTIYINGKKPILVSKTIKSFEKVLGEPIFTRIHRGYIVNLSEVTAHLRSNGGELEMSNGDTLSVSKSNHVKIQSLFSLLSAFI